MNKRLSTPAPAGAAGESRPTFERRRLPVKELELYRLVLDSIHNGAVVTDPDGYVLYFNEPYGRFLGIEAEKQIGKHVTEVIENTRMHVVSMTGKAEINVVQRIKGQDMVVQRIPIRKNGKIIAVFGQVMFKDVRDIGKLARKLCILESKVRLYEQELLSLRSTRYTLDSIVGVSSSIVSLKKAAQRAAATDLPVLITGESGTGKEIFAHAIHNASSRRLYPFIRINCAAIPRDLLESELFGYERGAFTGAKACGKPGKFELAHHGSIFLDEIGDLPPETQPKLLRVLEEKEFERIGGTSYVSSNFRLIAASNQDLKEMIAAGRFRTDLFYRLNVLQLPIPPLRERREDIPVIAAHMLAKMCEESSLAPISADPRAAEALFNYDWPGNVRELYNVLSRVLSFLEGDVIRLDDLPVHIQNRSRPPGRTSSLSADYIYYSMLGGTGLPLREAASSAEKESIARALAASGNNKARAARALGIHRTLLYKKMKKHSIC